MEAMRQMKLDTLKARIGNADYEVDTDAVAEAIVRRLLELRRTVERDPFAGGGAPQPG
jgi:Txe/YoeB family toxin of Txe-Axe toxin-antitoxin module